MWLVGQWCGSEFLSSWRVGEEVPEKLQVLATLEKWFLHSTLPLNVLSVIVGLRRKACWATP